MPVGILHAHVLSFCNSLSHIYLTLLITLSLSLQTLFVTVKLSYMMNMIKNNFK